MDAVTQTAENISKSIQAKVEIVKSKLDGLAEKIPEPIMNFIKAILDKLASWKGLAVSFTAGFCIATAAIIYPIYASVENLSQPVTLFETILGDLEQAYVDPVDTNKLFETGVSAMLRSLDPYTEFEGAEEAVAMNESIEGKYGGVGLVIAGTPSSAKSRAESKLLPAAAVQDNEDSDLSTSTKGMTEEEEEDYVSRKAERKAIDKAKKDGIRVVTAFEGYAFDYGKCLGFC